MAQANPEDERWDAANQQKEEEINCNRGGGGIKINNATATATATATTTTTSSTSGFKFNAQAAEFIPRSHHNNIKVVNPTITITDDDTNQLPISPSSSSSSSTSTSGYFYPSCLNMQMQFLDADQHWYYVNNTPSTTTTTTTTTTATPHPACSFSLFPHSLQIPATVTTRNNNNNNPLLTQDLQQKIVKQVEYLFSDLSLMANDTMAKHVSKDPEGYVPIPVIASMKKIKALVTDHHLLVQALASSTKLIISKDSKKVKRRNPFTEHYKDELQSRTVIVENLPDDHSYQNLEKIFGVVGSVKAIRLCHPPEANPSRSKTEVIISNKLHALVEYENGEIAERAAERLNDERNWRKGMRVRVMQRRTPKSVLKGRKVDFDSLTLTDDEEPRSPESPHLQETLQHHQQILNAYTNAASDSEEYSPGSGSGSGSRKSISNSLLLRGPGSGSGSGAGRGKTKGRISIGSGPGRGLLVSPTATTASTNSDAVATSPLMSKQQPIGVILNKGPRMPDGTRGFTMGRGKPLKS